MMHPGSLRQGAFTLVEVMSATALLGVFTAAALALSGQMLGGYHRAETYGDDLHGCRDGLRLLTRDLHAARHAVARPGALDLRLPQGGATWRLDAGTLTRAEAGREQVVARGIAELEASVEQDLVHVALTLKPRARGEAVKPAIVATTVRLRAPEGPR